jgi:hypothetical protein
MTAPSNHVTTLLRRYFIKPDGWDNFLETWRKIVVLRQRYGFKVVFAYADRELNVFTWAIQLEGDLEEVQARYYKDPERVALEIVGNWVTDYEIREVEPVSIT